MNVCISLKHTFLIHNLEVNYRMQFFRILMYLNNTCRTAPKLHKLHVLFPFKINAKSFMNFLRFINHDDSLIRLVYWMQHLIFICIL